MSGLSVFTVNLLTNALILIGEISFHGGTDTSSLFAANFNVKSELFAAFF